MDYLAQGLQIVGSSLISSGGQPIENNTQKRLNLQKQKQHLLLQNLFKEVVWGKSFK